MRIVTLNVNGLRSAAAKGLMPWLQRQKADLVCPEKDLSMLAKDNDLERCR